VVLRSLTYRSACWINVPCGQALTRQGSPEPSELDRTTDEARRDDADLPIEGLARPLTVKIDFDAGVIDQMIERLLVLRAQMIPVPLRPSLRN
jgi:hypothetical protein